MQRQKHHDGSHFIIRQAQAGNSDRKNNHFRESNIGRVSPALRINHANVSVRGFYPTCAFYTPSIRRHSTSSHHLGGPRGTPGVPRAAVPAVPGAAVAPAGHSQAGLLPVSHVARELLTPLAQLFSLRCSSRLLFFIFAAVAVLWRLYSNSSSRCLSPVEM